jgi:small subunit ribosomal protein S3
MGQKVNPVGFRTGTYVPWKSRWFAEKGQFKENLLEDIQIRKVLAKKLTMAGLESVDIERLPKMIKVIISVSRPGLVIGRGGSGLEDLKKQVVTAIWAKKVGKQGIKIDFQVNEIKNSDISAKIILDRVIMDLEKRIPQRRVVTKVMERALQAGALGIKIVLAGRIGGAEISRVEKYHMGSVPTQTLRETIDYAEAPASLKRGYVGVKVYVHKKKE